MNAADADGDAQQVTQELDDAAIGTAADQRQGEPAKDEQRHRDRVRGARAELLGDPAEQAFVVTAAAGAAARIVRSVAAPKTVPLAQRAPVAS